MSRLFPLASVPLAVVLAGATAVPAFAFQKFENYRISGNEIVSAELGPMEAEDPATLVITLDPKFGGPDQIVLESDDELEDCKMLVDQITGDAWSYIDITVQVTADTMNGVLLTSCVRLSLPQP